MGAAASRGGRGLKLSSGVGGATAGPPRRRRTARHRPGRREACPSRWSTRNIPSTPATEVKHSRRGASSSACISIGKLGLIPSQTGSEWPRPSGRPIATSTSIAAPFGIRGSGRYLLSAPDRQAQGDSVTDYSKPPIDGAVGAGRMGSETIDAINPSTKASNGTGRNAAADVELGRRRGQGGLRDVGLHLSKEDRGKYVQAIAEGLAGRSEEIAQVISDEMGMPLNVGQHDPGRPADRQHRRATSRSSRTSRSRSRSATRSSCGSRSAWWGAITPWNYPLHQVDRQGRSLRWPPAAPSCSSERGGAAQRFGLAESSTSGTRLTGPRSSPVNDTMSTPGCRPWPPRHGAGAGHEVEHARRETDLVDDLGQDERVERRDLAGLSTTVHPAASDGRDLGHDLVQRVVPRRDAADHADRLPHDERVADLLLERESLDELA